jgi:hypothetical protein
VATPTRSVFLLFFCIVVMADVSVHALSGNDWIRLSASGREVYVAGIVDAWENIAQIQKYADARDARLTPVIRMYTDINACIMSRRFSYAQMSAIIEKYVRRIPMIGIPQWLASHTLQLIRLAKRLSTAPHQFSGLFRFRPRHQGP